ncbi:MAG: 5-(carboxyamino)imidazole ribonucleotide synthase [Pseudomonadota bacterium]
MKIGILGAGQLARMLAEAGMPLGHEFVFLDPAEQPSAARLGLHLQAPWNDSSALAVLAQCDRVTCDFENVPARVLSTLAQQTQVRPSARAFEVAQDRLTEKQQFEAIGLATPGYRAVSSRPELIEAVERLGLPAVLKTRRLGYDGKGQCVLQQREDLELAWQQLGGEDLILEQWVAFDHEASITAVRSSTGDVRTYPLSTTVHRAGMLRFAHSAPVAGALQAQAEQAVLRLLDALDYVGCMTLELFVLGDQLMANECAPRAHNSAHWTIEAAVCSQFENHLRAVCDAPLGDTTARGQALMINFIGQLPPADPWLQVPGLAWHDYNKTARIGRKVGHATLVAHDQPALIEQIERIAPLLEPAEPALLSALF